MGGLNLGRLGPLTVLAIGLAACGGSSSGPPPPPQPRPVSVTLGQHGGTITLQSQAGGYTLNGRQVSSGATVEGSNGLTYRLTLQNGQWSAQYVPPDPVVIQLGTSGGEVKLDLAEDGTYRAGATTVASGDAVTSLNGSTYRLTLSDGEWQAAYVAPDPVTVALGASGHEVTLVRNEDGSFQAGATTVESGGTVPSPNGGTYRLTLVGSEWQASYEPPDPAVVTLGGSGEQVIVTRNEDGSYTAGQTSFRSGGTVTASNGSGYRLTLIDGEWRVQYVPPAPATVALGTSGEQVIITRNEDGFYRVNGLSFEPGSTWTARTGAQYRLALSGGEWSAEFVPSQVALVQLGTSGDSLSVQQLEDGRFEADGEPLVSGATRTASNGNAYRLTLVNGQWIAEYTPARVAIQLGAAGGSLILVREEDGRYWLNRMVVESGDTHTAPNGDIFRLTFAGGEWSATFVPETIRVAAGDSGSFLVILRLEDGTYWLGSRQVFSGDTVVQDGSEYVLRRSGRTWTASFRAGTVQVDLPLGGSITLTKREDGTYTWNGRVIRSGSTYTINGVRYRLTLGSDGWRAVRRTFVTNPVDPDPPPNRGSGETDTIEQRLGDSSVFGLQDAGDSSRGTEGTHLVVGPTDNAVLFAVEDLLDRDVVRNDRTYAEAARETIETVIETLRRFTAIYEIDEDFLRNPELGLAAQWALARAAFDRIPGGHAFPSTPWRSTPESRHVDDAIEDLVFVTEALSGRSAFEDEFGSEEGFDEVMAKLVFGSIDNARFGAFANRRSDGSWDTGHFAYSPEEEPSSSEVGRQGGATYLGDTVAVYDDSTDEPQTYTGTMNVTATFSTGAVEATVTELLNEDDNDFEYNGGSLTSIVLPAASLADPDEADRGSFTVEGTSTLRLSGAPDVERNTSFDGQFVDSDMEAFGTWQLELDGSSETLSGAFGLERRTQISPSVSFIDSTGHKVLATAYPRDGEGRQTVVQGATDSLPSRDFTIMFKEGDIAFTASPASLNLRSGRATRQDIEHPDGEDVGSFWLESTNVTRFGAWAIASRTDAPAFTATGGAAFAYSPLAPPTSGSVDALRFTAQYRGGARAVVHNDSVFTIFAGKVEADIDWNVGADDEFEVRLYDFTRITGASDLLLNKEIFFEDSAAVTHEQFETDAISVDTATATGSIAIRLVGSSVDGPVGMIGGWLAVMDAGTAEGSFGADLRP